MLRAQGVAGRLGIHWACAALPRHLTQHRAQALGAMAILELAAAATRQPDPAVSALVFSEEANPLASTKAINRFGPQLNIIVVRAFFIGSHTK
jgi:hypothetical protein